MEFSKLGVKFRNEVLGIDSENGALEIGDVCLKMRLWERVFWNENLGMRIWECSFGNWGCSLGMGHKEYLDVW